MHKLLQISTLFLGLDISLWHLEVPDIVALLAIVRRMIWKCY
jgi:hypothetical protein